MALQRQFMRPILVMLTMVFGLLLAGSAHHDMTANDRSYWLLTGIAGVIVFLADSAALFWMGMWQGLSAKNPKDTLGATFVPILVLPWVGAALVVTAIELLPHGIRQSFRHAALPLMLWFVFSLMADVVFGLRARYKLLTEFREAASRQFQQRPSWWQRLLGVAGPGG